MTKEQIQKLCELDPERFYHWKATHLYWDPNTSKDPARKGMLVFLANDPSNLLCARSAACWWMLHAMRARFNELYEELRMADFTSAKDPWLNQEYMALDDFMGTEATNIDEDAVINAYISWKQSCATAGHPTKADEQGE
jgi:hypothetical protein